MKFLKYRVSLDSRVDYFNIKTYLDKSLARKFSLGESTVDDAWEQLPILYSSFQSA